MGRCRKKKIPVSPKVVPGLGVKKESKKNEGQKNNQVVTFMQQALIF